MARVEGYQEGQGGADRVTASLRRHPLIPSPSRGETLFRRPAGRGGGRMFSGGVGPKSPFLAYLLFPSPSRSSRRDGVQGEDAPEGGAASLTRSAGTSILLDSELRGNTRDCSPFIAHRFFLRLSRTPTGEKWEALEGGSAKLTHPPETSLPLSATFRHGRGWPSAERGTGGEGEADRPCPGRTGRGAGGGR